TVLAAGLIGIGEGEGKRSAPFVAMELLAGETLGSVLAREGAIPWRRVLAWVRDVAAALDVIHGRGIVHLDLKPSNLFLTKDGAIKVLDFGIARRAGALSAPAGTMLGGEEAAMVTAEFLAGRKDRSAPSVPPPSFGSMRSQPGSL